MALDDHQLTGFDDLAKNLKQLEAATGAKVLRQSASAAVTPAMRLMRARAPKGSRAHRTHKGRLVAPGFVSRSIKKRSFVGRDGRVHVIVGVAAEAWYGLLYETGFRRGKRSAKVKRASRAGSLSSAHLDALGDTRQQIPGNNWFSGAFIMTRDETETRFADGIRKRIEKIRAKA